MKPYFAAGPVCVCVCVCVFVGVCVCVWFRPCIRAWTRNLDGTGGTNPGASSVTQTSVIQYSVICLRGNGVILRTQKVIQGDDNGHVGRPCEVSLAPP